MIIKSLTTFKNLIVENPSRERFLIREELAYIRANISDRAHSIVYGTLLGDGSCNKGGTIEIERALAAKDYVDWFYKEFEGLRTNLPPRISIRTDRRFTPNRKTYSYYFLTRAIFKDYREKFYPKKFDEDGFVISERKVFL